MSIFHRKRTVAYVDEVGRGCLVGPVVACAVIITAQAKLKIYRSPTQLPLRAKKRFYCKSKKGKTVRLGDSKKLTAKQREQVFEIVTRIPHVQWAVASVSPKTIDKINIFEATKLAIRNAVKKLPAKPNFLIVDGNMKISLRIPQKSVVKADEKLLPCSIASIIAKVTRDRMMMRLHKKYPQYGFNTRG